MLHRHSYIWPVRSCLGQPQAAGSSQGSIIWMIIQICAESEVFRLPSGNRTPATCLQIGHTSIFLFDRHCELRHNEHGLMRRRHRILATASIHSRVHGIGGNDFFKGVPARDDQTFWRSIIHGHHYQQMHEPPNVTLRLMIRGPRLHAICARHCEREWKSLLALVGPSGPRKCHISKFGP